MRLWLGPHDTVNDPALGGLARLTPVGATATLRVGTNAWLYTSPNVVDLGRTLLAQSDDPRGATPTARGLRDFEQSLGGAAVNGATWGDVLWNAFTVNADPTGVIGPHPIIPNSKRILALRLGHGVVGAKIFRLGIPEATHVRTRLQGAYRALVQAVQSGRLDSTMPRKWLGMQARKYLVRDPENYFIPDDLPKVTAIEPTTAYSDNFDGGAETPLASPWAHLVNSNNQTAAGKAQGNGNPSVSYYSALSGDDHWSEIANNFDANCGAFVRLSTSAQTGYIGWISGSLATQLYEVTTGTFAQIGTNGSNAGNTSVIRCEVDGSDLQVYLDGAAQANASGSDTSITGNLNPGIRTFNNSRLDLWAAEDLAAAGGGGSTRRRFLPALGVA